MNDFSFTPCEPNSLLKVKNRYRQTLQAPLDGMWEAFTAMANHYVIAADSNPVGFCAVNDDKKLLQVSLDQGCDVRAAYAAMIAALEISGAIVATCESAALALAMDRHQTVAVTTFLYQYPEGRPPLPNQIPADSTFREIRENELGAAVAFAHKTLGASEDWLTFYFTDLISRGELFGLRRDGQLIGTGELRPSATQPSFADAGMIVGTGHRGKGLATRILQTLVSLALARGLTPICSTEIDNVAAQKAINRAGFSCTHRMLDITF